MSKIYIDKDTKTIRLSEGKYYINLSDMPAIIDKIEIFLDKELIIDSENFIITNTINSEKSLRINGHLVSGINISDDSVINVRGKFSVERLMVRANTNINTWNGIYIEELLSDEKKKINLNSEDSTVKIEHSNIKTNFMARLGIENVNQSICIKAKEVEIDENTRKFVKINRG